MQFGHLNSKEDEGLMSIEDLRALRLRKKKIENDKKARKYILDINKRYRKISRRNRSSIWVYSIKYTERTPVYPTTHFFFKFP